MNKRIVLFCLIICLSLGMRVSGWCEDAVSNNSMPDQTLALESESYVLMEKETGQIICEKNREERLSPASITKIMTLYLIFEDLNDGKIHLEDEVTTSAYAKSMGGSQVFLEEGEIQSVETLIKCIAIASGNDASVCMAEYIEGSEDAFVNRMNRTAENMGLTNTHFVDCCGLTSSDEHYTCAGDIALLTRNLLLNHPQVLEYTGIWTEDIVHKTRKGESNFTLSSTNKLLKLFPYTTGMKTGSTDKAGYCFSATATQGNLDLIAVVMKAPTPKLRFQEAKTLLEYGFANCSLYKDENGIMPEIPVRGGKEKKAKTTCQNFCYLDTRGRNLSEVKRSISMETEITAPEKKGEKVGCAEYYLGEERIGSVEICLKEDVKRATFGNVFSEVFHKVLL